VKYIPGEYSAWLDFVTITHVLRDAADEMVAMAVFKRGAARSQAADIGGAPRPARQTRI
jgi:hypothetical protein